MAKVRNKYIWSSELKNAPPIQAHSKIKHSIIRDYIHSYLKVVANPLTSHVKLSIVDGFCGGGLYRAEDGMSHFGSPIIILDVLRETIAEILADRLLENIKREFSLECDVYFVDKDLGAINALKEVAAAHLIVEDGLPLKISAHFIHAGFVDVYKDISQKIGKSKAIFILDPCGYTETPLPIIHEIMQEPGHKREMIWTLMIDSMLAYANEDSVALINAGYSSILNLFRKEDEPSNFSLQKEIFLTVSREVGVPFFTPFAVKQQLGWNYWLIHLAWHHRASEVMKEVEHRHANQREHYGRSGLKMMASEGERVYLFNQDDIERGRDVLREDIPQILSECDDEGITFEDFMKRTYNETPLKSDVIKETLITHEDIEVSTITKGSRFSAKRIKTNDIIRLKRQKFFNFGFSKSP